MLVVKNIAKVFGIRTILKGVTFALGPGQKAALVGPNGVGKSTLLKILAGIESANKGEVNIARHIGVGYLSQEIEAGEGENVEDYLRRVSGIADIENRMRELESGLDDQNVLREYAEVSEWFQRAGGYDFERRMRTVLDGFQMSSVALDHPVRLLSGGQKIKLSLSAILLKGVDMLFLDEPTNNLDLPALIWLEEYLIQSPAICVIASHDRRFLDRVVTKVLEIDWFKHDATLHTGNYTEYAERKALELRRVKEAYRLQQEELKRLDATAREKNVWAAKGAVQPWSDNDKMGRNFARDRSKKLAVTGKAIETRLEKVERVEKLDERTPLALAFENDTRELPEGARDIVLSQLEAGYGSSFRIGPISMALSFGSRVAIMGLNGSGKSTLLKTIVGDIEPLGGSVEKGEAVKFGNFAQEHAHLPKDKTISWLFGETAGMYDAQELALFLQPFYLGFDVKATTIGALSPGERGRLMLALYMKMNVNVLLLDEPTNHLDSDAIEALEEMLRHYTGTVVLVTHDRYFLEQLPDFKTYVLSKGILEKLEDYEAYTAAIAVDARRMLRRLNHV